MCFITEAAALTQKSKLYCFFFCYKNFKVKQVMIKEPNERRKKNRELRVQKINIGLEF